MLPLKDSERSGIFPFITYVIIILCAIALFLEFSAPNPDAFISKWALNPSEITLLNIGSLITLVTSIFLHGGLMHFLSNMLYLWIFGDNVEADLGSFGFLLFYLTGGVVANLSQLFFLQNENIPVLGASGAIAAVLGYYLVSFPTHRIKTLIIIVFYITVVEIPALLILGLWFITQLLNGTTELVQTSASSGVAFWAHIGGFIFGVLVAFFIKAYRKHSSQKHLKY